MLALLFLAVPSLAQLPAVPAPVWGEHDGRPRDYDLEHLKIELALDLDARRIEGTVTSRVRALAGGLAEAGFDAVALSVRTVTVDGAPADHRTEGDRLVVKLPRRLDPGARADVAVAYEATPRNGLHWVGPEPGYPDKPRQVWSQGQAEDNRHWLPMHDYPNDKTTWEAAFTCPEGLTAVSNGKLVGEDVGARPGTRVFRWSMDRPNSTYLIAVAVGPWERWADDWRGKPVEYWVARGVGEETARRSFGLTPDMLTFFSDRIGVEYPWARYAQVAVAEFVVGGMENVSCTLQTDRTLHDARAALEQSSQGLVAHELAHQWWGDLLTCRDWSHLWLNEGFATYFECLYAEHHDGVDQLRVRMRQNQEAVRRGDARGEPRAMVEDFYARKSGDGSNHVYTKGASVLHMLRFTLGDDAFWRGIRLYCERHREGLVDTHDFRKAMEDATGRPLQGFFQQWVFLAGCPEFQVRQEWDEPSRTARLNVKQAQKTGGLVPVFRTPVDVEFTCGSEARRHRIEVTRAEETFSFQLPERPRRTRFDKGGWLLKTLVHEKPLEEWLAQAVEDDDVIGRFEAIEALAAREGEPRAGEALGRVLASDAHRAVRVAAAEALGKRKGDAARDALVAALGDREATVRAAAVEALGKRERDAAAGAALRRALESDAAYGVRAAAARALAAGKHEGAFEAIEAVLPARSHHDQVAEAALRSLFELDAARAVPALLADAAYGRPYERRTVACELLARHAPKAATAERERIAKVLRDGLQDRYYRMRLSAIRALGAAQDRDALEALDRIAAEDPARRYRTAAKEAAERLRKETTGAQPDLKAELEALRKRVETLEKAKVPER
jgi:aminopeptidase N